MYIFMYMFHIPRNLIPSPSKKQFEKKVDYTPGQKWGLGEIGLEKNYQLGMINDKYVLLVQCSNNWFG